MAGPTQVYRDAQGHTFKATAEYAALHGWTLAEPAADTDPDEKARGQAANKARTASANK